MDIVEKLRGLPPPPKCEHGVRIGRCDTCGLTAAETHIAELEATHREAVESVAELERREKVLIKTLAEAALRFEQLGAAEAAIEVGRVLDDLFPAQDYI